MELYLWTISKISKKFATRSFWTLPVPDSFNLYFLLFYIVNFYVYYYEHTPIGFAQNTEVE